MFLLVVLTIAVWFIPNIPIALPILATIACSMSLHLTIRNTRLQRILAHFGEVLAIFLNKQHQNVNKESASKVMVFLSA